MTFIIEKLPAIEKRILTSATQTIDIPEFTGIKDPVELNYLTDELVEGLSLKVVHSDSKDKTDTLLKLIGQIGSEPVLVFCNHRETVEQIGKFLNKSGVIHDVYHGKLEQFEREISLVKFRNGSNNILITTDLASRGLDIDAMKNVVHFHIPTTEAAFIHRNGRTARMHTEGNAYMILSEEEYLPGYITTAPDVVEMPTHIKFPASPAWSTIHVTGGKKEKINKVDLVGLFLKKGNLPKEQLGKIEVGDHHSYVAVKKDRARPMMQLLGQEKIKGYKIKMELV